MKIKIDVSDFFGMLVSKGIKKMALQATFKYAKAYSLQNAHDGEILKRKFIYEVKRPKKDKKLPVVLSKDEIKRILKAPTNLKHRAILVLAYSAGLRVSELTRLKSEDIDVKRGLIHIKGSK